MRGYRALGAVNAVRKRAQEQYLSGQTRTHDNETQEDKAIEQTTKNNTITNDNRRKEADSAANKERRNIIVTQQDVRKPCAIKLPIGFFDSDKVRILYG